MKTKLTKNGLVLVSESTAEDAEMKSLYNKGLMLYGKVVGVNEAGRKEGLFQNKIIHKVTADKTMADEPLTDDDLFAMVKTELYDRGDRVDEFAGGAGHDWDSLVQGWALAKGLSPQEAADFAHKCHVKNFSNEFDENTSAG